jgi:hypothetical protein
MVANNSYYIDNKSKPFKTYTYSNIRQKAILADISEQKRSHERVSRLMIALISNSFFYKWGGRNNGIFE